MAKTSTRPMINASFQGKSILSIDQFTRDDIETVIHWAEKLAKARLERRIPQLLKGMVFKAVMFEDSSRTAGSFMSAAAYLGAHIDRPDLKSSSMNKGESDIETVRCFAGQADVLLVRHKSETFADEVATRIKVPFQNGGNGRADHPSQTLLDLFTFKQRYGTLDGLRLVIFGDVANNRPARSLLRGLSLFNDNEIIIAAPKHAAMPDEVIAQAQAMAKKTHTTIRQVEDLRPLLKEPGIFYGSRPRNEYGDEAAAKKMEKAYRENGYIISHETMAEAHANADITHALPHNYEISDDFYTDPRAFYFAEEDNGVPVRMALLALQMAESGLRWHDFDGVIGEEREVAVA